MKKIGLKGNRIKIILHILAWSIIMGLPLYVTRRWSVGKDFLWLYYINILINGIIFYSNYLLLIPRFFMKGRRIRYFLSVALLIACFYFVSDFSNKLIINFYPPPDMAAEIRPPAGQNIRRMPPARGLLPIPNRFRPLYRNMHLANYMGNSLFLIFFSLGLSVLERQSKIEELKKDLERDKLNSELAFLKNQISPHFFFNTLNNIYSLIGINTSDAQNAVLKLSRLMRYMLYESEQGNPRLSSEIAFMNNYIDLMKLRMSEKVSLEVSFPEKPGDVTIPPLLFVPFIENAFKYGISNREKSYIRISMLTMKDSITFRCVNSCFQKTENEEGQHSGIGLENVRKRLSLLFPGKHDLKIKSGDNEFEVLLFLSMT